MHLFELTVYQSYLLYAYLVGVVTQIVVLYCMSCYYNDLTFIMYYALIYIVLSGLQFLCFLKLIESKED